MGEPYQTVSEIMEERDRLRTENAALRKSRDVWRALVPTTIGADGVLHDDECPALVYDESGCDKDCPARYDKEIDE
jgi:hypothetical protein